MTLGDKPEVGESNVVGDLELGVVARPGTAAAKFVAVIDAQSAVCPV